ncbi:MAG: Calx-beta domain-containing protein [Pyrinomonadaceae bacterium]
MTPARKYFQSNHLYRRSRQFRVVLLALTLTLVLLLISGRTRLGAAASPAVVAPPQQPESAARLSDAVSVRVADRGSAAASVNLQDGREVLAEYEGDGALVQALNGNNARPLALAAADFDEDGTPDLVIGYANGADGGGIVTIHRGNIHAIYPNSPEARQRGRGGSDSAAAPFLSPARAFSLKATAPDFIGAGDFNADGHWDVVTASRGGRAWHLLAGDGRGNLAAAQEIALPGTVTALVTGEINRADGLTDVVIGVDGEDGAQALVFESPRGAGRAKPEVLSLPASPTSLALGQLDQEHMFDLIVAAGHELVFARGRDRQLARSEEEQAKVAPARVERRAFDGAIKSVAIGRFGESREAAAALLLADGTVEVLRRGAARDEKQQSQVRLSAWSSEQIAAREWTGARQLAAANVSSQPGDDLLLLDPSAESVRVLPGGGLPATGGEFSATRLRQMKEHAARTVTLSLTDNAPVAALTMQLNADALADLLILREGHSAPIFVPTAVNEEAAERQLSAQLAPLPLGTGARLGSAPTNFGTPPNVAREKVGRGAAAKSPLQQQAQKTGERAGRIVPLQATCPATQMTIGQGLNGTLSTSDCIFPDGNFVDTYTFNGTAGQSIAVEMSSAEFDTYLNLLGPNGALLEVDDDSGGGNNSRIPSEGGFYTLPANGTYTIYATSFNPGATGSYSLLLATPGSGGCPVTPAQNGQIVSGSLSQSDCFFPAEHPRAGSFVDIYTFTGFAGQQAVIEMESSAFDTYLYLLASDGSFTENDDVSPGNTNSRIPPSGVLTLPFNGVYTIYATSFGAQRTGDYLFRLSLGTPPVRSTVVINTNDAGPGSLRDAILNSNSNPGVDTIRFQIGSGAQTIRLLSALPTITDPVVIDGTTQPGFTGTPLVEIDGQSAQNAAGLEITAGDSRVRGLVLNRFGVADCGAPLNVFASGTAIILNGAGRNIIEGNYIGTNASGTAVLCNSGNGIYVRDSIENLIGGTTPAARNIISGNRLPGVAVGGFASFRNSIVGNYIGTDVTGAFDLGNRSNGIIITDGTDNFIGGTAAGARNVISGNDSPGVAIAFSDPEGVIVQGNYIGTNAAGSAAIPNQGGGIIVGGFSQRDNSAVTAKDNLIGGTTPAARNIISGNVRVPGDTNLDSGNGIEIINEGSENNLVLGNYIGLNAAGNADLGNTGSGIFITRAPNNFIGSPIEGAANYIAGNGRYGVGVGIRRLNDNNPSLFITGGDSIDILFNVIGTDPTQTLRLGNDLDGVYVDADSVDIYVQLNVIAFNGGSGVRIPDANGIRDDNDNSGRLVNLDLNFIFANFNRAIDLGFAGLTENDAGDVDGGANLQQNFPEPLSARVALPDDANRGDDSQLHNTTVTTNWRLPAMPNRTYIIHWYFTGDSQCTSNGQLPSRPLVFNRLTTLTDASGIASFDITLDLPPGVPSGVISCTATEPGVTTNNPQGNTSESSQCMSVSAAAAASQVQFSQPTYTVNEGNGTATITVARSGSTGGAVSVQYATSNGTATAGQDYTAQSGTINFAAGVASQSFTFPITNDTTMESSETVNLTLSNPTGGATLGSQNTATLTITDNDAPTVQFAAAAANVGEGEGRASLTITRSGDPSGALSVAYATVDNPAAVPCSPQLTAERGVAYARCDYATAIDFVTFAPGDSQPKTITVPLIDDAHVEGAETFSIVLSNSSAGATLGAAASVIVTITDNDTVAAIPNPVYASREFFVRQQYLDFLSREPDEGGLAAWLRVLNRCPNIFTGHEVASDCDRILVSGIGFFDSPEFRLKGFYVFLFYRASLDRLAEYTEIAPDLRSVTGQTPADTFAKRAEFADNFVRRTEFMARYDRMSNDAYVEALLGRYQLQQIMTEDPANPEGTAEVVLTRGQLVSQLAAGTLTRARVLRAIVQSREAEAAERNRAFVAMQYYGYLRRTPEESGYNANVNFLNRNPNGFREIINGFLNSREYQIRFGRIEQ